MPQVGSTIVIADPANFYFGRKAVVRAVSTFREVTVLTVAIDGGNVSCCLRADEAEVAA